MYRRIGRNIFLIFDVFDRFYGGAMGDLNVLLEGTNNDMYNAFALIDGQRLDKNRVLADSHAIFCTNEH